MRWATPAEAEAADRRRRITSSPEFTRLKVLEELDGFATDYGPFFELLGLSRKSREELTELLYDRRHVLDDLGSALQKMQREGQLPIDGIPLSEWSSAKSVIADENMQAIRKLLGDKGVAELQDYDKEIYAASAVIEVRQVMASSYATLSPAATIALLNKIAATPAKMAYPSTYYVEPNMSAVVTDNSFFSEGSESLYSGAVGAQPSEWGFVSSPFALTKHVLDFGRTNLDRAGVDAIEKIMEKQNAERAIGREFRLPRTVSGR